MRGAWRGSWRGGEGGRGGEGMLRRIGEEEIWVALLSCGIAGWEWGRHFRGAEVV